MKCYIDRDALCIIYYKDSIENAEKIINFKTLDELEHYIWNM